MAGFRSIQTVRPNSGAHRFRSPTFPHDFTRHPEKDIAKHLKVTEKGSKGRGSGSTSVPNSAPARFVDPPMTIFVTSRLRVNILAIWLTQAVRNSAPAVDGGLLCRVRRSSINVTWFLPMSWLRPAAGSRLRDVDLLNRPQPYLASYRRPLMTPGRVDVSRSCLRTDVAARPWLMQATPLSVVANWQSQRPIVRHDWSSRISSRSDDRPLGVCLASRRRRRTNS